MIRAKASRFAATVIARDLVAAVVSLLAPAGIAVAPLKGVLLARTVYDDPMERPLGDVDLLVSPARFGEALERLRAAGFGAVAAASTRNDSERCLAHPRWPLSLDLHRALFAPGRYALPTGAVLGRACTDTSLFGAPVLRLDPHDVLAHLVGHFAADHVDARDHVHVEDLVRIGRVTDLEPRAVAGHLVASGLGRAARYTLGIVASATGDPFARGLLAALPPDPLGELLASFARAVVARTPSRSRLGAIPAHLLNRSLAGAISAGSLATWRRLRPPPASVARL